jgi:hypothetical protein
MNTQPLDRVIDLLAGASAGGLDAVERQELDTLLAQLSPADRAVADAAAADFGRLSGATIASWSVDAKPLAADVRGRLLAKGVETIASSRGGGTNTTAPGMRPREMVAWLTAAASLAFAVLTGNKPPAMPEPAAPAWQARIQLLEAAETQTVAWSTTEDKDAKGVSGDIIWNGKEQRGFMRFKGLAANDPRVQQYQLWIFDKGRQDEFPVDGGVFDLANASRDPKTGDLVVPVQPKLLVKDPALFAVTLEIPGGVVVTKKERLLLLAKAGEK